MFELPYSLFKYLILFNRHQHHPQHRHLAALFLLRRHQPHDAAGGDGGGAGGIEGGDVEPSQSRFARQGRVAAPSIRSASLASCWPLPQQLLPVSATGGGRRCCPQRGSHWQAGEL